MNTHKLTLCLGRGSLGLKSLASEHTIPEQQWYYKLIFEADKMTKDSGNADVNRRARFLFHQESAETNGDLKTVNSRE